MVAIFIIVIVLLLVYFLLFNKKSKDSVQLDITERINFKIMADRKVTLENIIKLDSKTYEFDVFVEGINFQISAYQGVISFNENIINNGILTFQYLVGTSELNNIPQFGLGVNSSDGNKELTFGSGPIGDLINGKKRIGKFRIFNNVDFKSNEQLDLKWNFIGKIKTLFTGINFEDITNTILFNIISGDKNMITINESQKVLLTAEPISTKGNSAQIDGSVLWSVVSGSDIISLEPMDNFSVYAIAIGSIGNAIIKAEADADLTSNTSFISNTIDIEVIGGQAVTLNIIAGNVEEQ